VLKFFNHEMAQALASLKKAAASVGESRRTFLTCAIFSAQSALGEANRMKDAARRSLCLRILNWLRAAEREA
jgi:hypothetical protein